MNNYYITTWYSDEDECWFAVCSGYSFLSAYGYTEPEAVFELITVLSSCREDNL